MDDFLIDKVPPFSSPEKLHSWLSDEGVVAVYVHTAYMKNDSPIQLVMWEGLARYFDHGFSEGNSSIFLVRDIAVGN